MIWWWWWCPEAAARKWWKAAGCLGGEEKSSRGEEAEAAVVVTEEEDEDEGIAAEMEDKGLDLGADAAGTGEEQEGASESGGGGGSRGGLPPEAGGDDREAAAAAVVVVGDTEGWCSLKYNDICLLSVEFLGPLSCCTASLFMPTERHRLSLQARHWFLWVLSTTQAPSLLALHTYWRLRRMERCKLRRENRYYFRWIYFRSFPN